MATLTPQFFELLEADTKDIFFKHVDMIPELFSQLFKRMSSTKAYEDGMRVGGLGSFATKPEGTPIAFDDPVQGTRVRTVHTTYALGWRATMEMMQDDQFGIMNRMSGDMGDSARDHRERLAWSLVDDAFTGTTYTGLESEALFSTSHTLIKTGGTQSNSLSPAVELGQTGIESARSLLRTTTGMEGRYINLSQGGKLVFHSDLEDRVYELLNTEFQVDSSNNNRSTIVSSRSGLDPLGVPYLSSTTNWAIYGPNHTLTWNDRMPLTFSQAPDNVTLDRLHMSVYRASVMFRAWEGTVGSNF